MDLTLPQNWSSAEAHPLGGLYKALGHRVELCAGALWIDVGRFSLTSVPCGQLVHPCQDELEDLLRRTGRLAAQFPTSIPTGVGAHLFVVRDPAYGPGHQQRQFRQHVRRGSTSCEVRGVDWTELAAPGWPVIEDAYRRQGRPSAITRARWEAFCQAGAGGAGLGVTGCFVGGTLAAFLVHWTWGGARHGLILHRWTRFDPQKASHCLLDAYTTVAMGRDGMRGVTLGRQMVPADQRDRMTGVMKQHAGYLLEPVRVGAVLHPDWGRWIGGRWSRAVLEGVRRFAGGRLPALDNVEVLQAAAVTHLPGVTTAGSGAQPPARR